MRNYSKEEVGNIVAEDAEIYFKEIKDQVTSGPFVRSSKEALTVLVVNLVNFIRGKKSTMPPAFSAFYDDRSHDGVGPFVWPEATVM